MKLQSYSDIVTNSSSELFVFEDGKSVENVIVMLDSIYPNWLSEYDIPVLFKDTDFDGVDTVASYALSEVKCYETVEYCKRNNIEYNCVVPYVRCNAKLTKDNFDKDLSVAKKFAEELGGTPERIFKNWDKYNPFATDDEAANFDLDTYPKMTIYGFGLFQEKHSDYVLLWSCGENPDWSYQEKLMKVAVRHHLG